MDPLELLALARQGRPMAEDAFDLEGVYGTLKRLVEKYDIRYTPDDPVPGDDALADRVFQAAVDFFVDCGVFFKDTQTVVEFSREQVLEAVKNCSGECRFGEGAEARVFRPRKPDSDTRPWCHVGSGTVASSEEIASQIVWGNASIAAADSMSVNALDEIDGHQVVAGEPSEIRGAMRSIRVAREACRRAGREGLPIINGVAAAVSVTGTIAAANPTTGWRPSDGIIIGSLAEFKTNREMMAKVTWTQESGCRVVLASAPILGGYAGGPEATAILNTAYVLFGIVVYECDYYLSLPMHIHFGCSTSRDILWSVAVSSQAIARHTKMPTLSLPYCIGGPMTELFYYESAASVIAAVASGVSTQTPHPARAVLADYATPMEMRVTTEMALGAAGLSRKEASPIVDRVLRKYEGRLDRPDNGRSYTECFNVKTGQPTDEHRKFVDRVKRDLAQLGVPFREAVR